MKKFSEIVGKYAENSTEEQMNLLAKMTDAFLDKVGETMPELTEKYLMNTKEILCPFFDEDEAKEYTSHLKNIDGTSGAHWSSDDIFNAAETLGIPLESSKYKKWDLYAAINMIYSDLYDDEKSTSMYIKDGYRFVADPDFPRVGKMKIYALTSKRK